jgi:very-short-patch-repair endonuclease
MVVLEARVLPCYGAFDMMVEGARVLVLVEVDGAQHSYYGTSDAAAHEQQTKDKAKQEAAVRAGYHVVRLHYLDAVEEWCKQLVGALTASTRACMPRVWFTRSYATIERTVYG